MAPRNPAQANPSRRGRHTAGERMRQVRHNTSPTGTSTISTATSIPGTVRLRIKACKRAGSVAAPCRGRVPVTVPSSSTPTSNTPPSALVRQTTASTRSRSFSGRRCSPLNSRVRVSWPAMRDCRAASPLRCPLRKELVAPPLAVPWAGSPPARNNRHAPTRSGRALAWESSLQSGWGSHHPWLRKAVHSTSRERSGPTSSESCCNCS